MTYYHQSPDELFQILSTTPNGLTSEQADSNLRRFGSNTLPYTPPDSILKIFFSQFKDPMIILLLFATLASFIAHEIIDAIAIFFIILIDIVMGTYQENKANHTAEALAKLVTTKVKIIRDGTLQSINAEDLTIGDLVLLESGNKISADMRLIEAHNLTVDESILTGESVHVHKTPLPIPLPSSPDLADKKLPTTEQTNMVFSGTTVVTGRAKALVIAIGLQTEIGQIADSIDKTPEQKSPLTIRVEKLSRQISFLVIFVGIIIAGLLILKGVPHQEIFLSVIALAVAAMPEGLPLALTMALTIASNKMAKENVIVRKLKSAESLGSCTVIASDKTGTLTVNQQTAKKILLPDGHEYDISGVGFNSDGKIIGPDLKLARQIAFLGDINNEASLDGDNPVGDSIDIAFKFLASKALISPTKTSASTSTSSASILSSTVSSFSTASSTVTTIKILEIIPYESENKYSAVFYEKNGTTYCTVKGSLEVVTGFCRDINLINSDINNSLLSDQNESLAKSGYRVIALANGPVTPRPTYTNADIKNLTFMGLVGFIDPIRQEAISAIKDCRTAGIKVLMITGDHPLTAFSIARELDLVNDFNQVATGSELESVFSRGQKFFDDFIRQKIVFARVSPLQKLQIVESLKRQGEFVAVTGDGVNDSPALKAANIGIAMGSGSDITRETADMIIIDDNFRSIVAGIKEGRVAYANIRKIIMFLIGCGLGEVTFFCFAIIFDLPMPMVAIQLLWVNVVTDGIQDFALSFEKAEPGILREKPRLPQESIFNRDLVQSIIVAGLFVGILVFIVWYLLLNNFHFEVPLARGYIMALMVFIQNIHVFNCRSENKSAFSVPLRSNKLIIAAFLSSLVLQVLVMEIPVLAQFLQTSSIPLMHLIYLFGVASLLLIFMEIYKKIKYFITTRHQTSF